MYFNNETVYTTVKRAGWNQDNLNYNLNRETELPEETLEYDEELFRMSASLFSLSSFILVTLIFMLHFLWVALSDSAHLQGGPICNLFYVQESRWSEILNCTAKILK
jgi:hypothetical protein